ncbi:hypothetical protein SH449x_001315 [Pirellulaceae bacterium SH449]
MENGRTGEELRQWIETDGLKLGTESVNELNRWLVLSTLWDPDRTLLAQLTPLLQEFPELERGVVPLVAFLLATRSPGVFIGFLQRDNEALPVLLRILSLPTPASSWLISDEDCFDWLRLSAGQLVSAERLRDVIATEVLSVDDESVRLASMRSFRRRETLRVLCGFFLHGVGWNDVMGQLSEIADAAFYASWELAFSETRVAPERRQQIESGLIALAGGHYGGCELDLESPLQIQFLTEEEPTGVGRANGGNTDRSRIAERTMYWLTNADGFDYRVSRFLGSGNEPAVSNAVSLLSETLVETNRQWFQQIENQGRTQHRLALLRRRLLAGSEAFYEEWNKQVPSFVFRRNLSGADIVGLYALFRRIDRSASQRIGAISQEPESKLLGAWREELSIFVQYLQILYGGNDESLSLGNTRSAIDALANARHIQDSERDVLRNALHAIATASLQLQARSLEMTGQDPIRIPVADSFEEQLNNCREKMEAARDIWNRKQPEAFLVPPEVAVETDLILDPAPDRDWANRVLKSYGFVRLQDAIQNLQELAQEEIRMLSTKRCRHYLAKIAPSLLSKISQTPNPDLTLENLVETTRSLGGKGVLWELFSFHEPSMDLYIRICGASAYLVSILTKNPGMIDELLDSLMLNRLPSESQLHSMLTDLCRGAADLEPVLTSFKNAMHLNVGVRDILGKENVSATHNALTDIADVCVRRVIESCYRALVEKFGVPTTRSGQDCPFAILTVGKYGSREPNYHSDMSLLCIYEEEGVTTTQGASKSQTLDHCDFFHQLVYRITQSINRLGRYGRLYEAKPWIVGEDVGSTAAWRRHDFENLFSTGEISAIKKVEFCSARCIGGTPGFLSRVNDAKSLILGMRHWTRGDSLKVLQHRLGLEQGVSPNNIKRGQGGTIEVELLTKVLLLTNFHDRPEHIAEGTIEGLENLSEHGHIDSTDYHALREGYLFLRRVESGLRLMNTTARHDLPTGKQELERLAYVIRLQAPDSVAAICDQHRASIRTIFERVFSEMEYHP